MSARPNFPALSCDMDERIDSTEEQRCWMLGYESAPGAVCPYEMDGDGFRAAAWDMGVIDRCNAIRALERRYA